uniref:C-C chemokine receptor-like 2 n=1 Tax=Jaculus jaculus TaxID=51337 RepID=UPI001E1B1D46|nr:C-C chemokine receptor-like 2 [Jaculus jaculus]
MANYTVAPEDEYDVLIEGDLENIEVDQPGKYDADVLSAEQALLLCSTVFVIGFLDNILVVFILVKYKTLKNVGNIYLLNLAVSNLCFLFPLPFWTYITSHEESPGDPMCKVLVGLHSASLQGEVLFNILLLVQGYKVCAHMRSLSASFKMVPYGVITSVLMWVVAILIILPELIFYEPQMERKKYTCCFSRYQFLLSEETFKSFLTLKMNILVLVFPLFVFIFCFVQMRKVRSSEGRQCDLCKLAFVTMGVFLLMWTPYNIALFLSTLEEHLFLEDKNRYNLDVSVQVTKIIAISHCCVNPLLYLLLDKDFRKYLCSLFPLCEDISFQTVVDSAQATMPREGDNYSTDL